MKYLIPLLLLFAACKKEEPPHPSGGSPSTSQPTHPSYVVVTGHSHSGDTVFFPNLSWGSYYAAYQKTNIFMSDTTAAQNTTLSMWIHQQAAGIDSLIEDFNPASSLSFNGESYVLPRLRVNVTKYDQVGGQIQGTYSGTWQWMNNNSDTLHVTGAFKVTRQ